MKATPPLPADLHALRDAIVELLTIAGAVSETAWNARAGDTTLREGFDKLFDDLAASKRKEPTVTRHAKSPTEKKWVDTATYWTEGEGAQVVTVLKAEFELPKSPFTRIDRDHGSRGGMFLLFIDKDHGEWVLEAAEAPKLWDALNNGQDPADLLVGMNQQFGFKAARKKGAARG